MQLAVGAPMYNCALGVYYLLYIRYNWTDGQLSRVEHVVHMSIITFAVGTSIALLPIGVYNHIGAVCWVMGLPQGCDNSNYTSGDDRCLRGNHAWLYGVALFYGPLWCCILCTTAAMVLIYQKVRDTERKSRRYSGTTARRSDDVFVQAVLYTAAFYVTWLPSTIWSITHWFDTPMFWLDLLATICEPSQGVLNLLVFVRPRKDLKEKLKRDILYVLSCGFCRKTITETFSSRPSSRQQPKNEQGGSDGREGGHRVSLMNIQETSITMELACARVKSNEEYPKDEADDDFSINHVPSLKEKLSNEDFADNSSLENTSSPHELLATSTKP